MATRLSSRVAPEDLRSYLEVLADRGTLFVRELGGLLQQLSRDGDEVASGFLESLGHRKHHRAAPVRGVGTAFHMAGPLKPVHERGDRARAQAQPPTQLRGGKPPVR